ncbi:hypothetical protein [Rhodopirellula bahusiensis]|nr:hypothetical protein [Rhodopirellula bahusiensis]
MKMTLKECLQGMAAEIRWGISDAAEHSVRFTHFLLDAVGAVLGGVSRLLGRPYRRGFSQVDTQLAKRGTPEELRKAIGFALGFPALVVRIALIGVVAILWVVYAPQVVFHTWETVVKVDRYPNKKRTPKMSRPTQRVDDFDDVRVRVSELTQ